MAPSDPPPGEPARSSAPDSARDPIRDGTQPRAVPCRTFVAQVLPWTADALTPRAAAAMRAHADACPPCAAIEARERAFDRRVTQALATTCSRGEVDALLARCRQGGRRRRVRPFALRAAAVLVALSTGAWALCIPPFECAYVSAIEEAAAPVLAQAGDAATARDAGDDLTWTAAEALARRVRAPIEAGGRPICGDAEPCIVRELGWEFPAVRAKYGEGAYAAVVVWCDSRSQHPSFRREREIDGTAWWTNGGDHPTFAAFRCERTGSVCSIVAPGGDALEVAHAIRGH